MTKIPDRIHIVTRPSPDQLFIMKRVYHHIIRDNNSLVFGVVVVDVELAESDAFKMRESDLEVSTDISDVFRAREAAMSAIRRSSSLRLNKKCWG
jgi:hypothetical protein